MKITITDDEGSVFDTCEIDGWMAFWLLDSISDFVLDNPRIQVTSEERESALYRAQAFRASLETALSNKISSGEDTWQT